MVEVHQGAGGEEGRHPTVQPRWGWKRGGRVGLCCWAGAVKCAVPSLRHCIAARAIITPTLPSSSTTTGSSLGARP